MTCGSNRRSAAPRRGTVVAAPAPEPTWLDRPLSNWNIPGRAMPRAGCRTERRSPRSPKRCTLLTVLRNTPGERAVADAGWLPFHMFDRQIVQRDVEIVGGLAGADGMCRPVDFNVFVFVERAVGRNALARRRWPRAPTAASAARFGWPRTTRSRPSSRAMPKRTRSVVPPGVSPSDTGSTARRLRLSWFRSACSRRGA